MKMFLLAFLFSQLSFAQTFNEKVLKAISQVPEGGGYVLTSVSAKKLRDAFSWNDQDQLSVNEETSRPSYCTVATYVVFFKVMKSYWDETGYPSRELQELFKSNLENDGERIWGRWNSNGPGTAKLFHDAGLGRSFEDLSEAQPGDFLKIYWNDEVGKNEKAHSVIYLGNELRDGVPTLTFWSSSSSTNGYGKKSVPLSTAHRLLFTRLETPANAVKLLRLPVADDFLASMLTRVSSWQELKTAVGL